MIQRIRHVDGFAKVSALGISTDLSALSVSCRVVTELVLLTRHWHRITPCGCGGLELAKRVVLESPASSVGHRAGGHLICTVVVVGGSSRQGHPMAVRTQDFLNPADHVPLEDVACHESGFVPHARHAQNAGVGEVAVVDFVARRISNRSDSGGTVVSGGSHGEIGCHAQGGGCGIGIGPTYPELPASHQCVRGSANRNTCQRVGPAVGFGKLIVLQVEESVGLVHWHHAR